MKKLSLVLPLLALLGTAAPSAATTVGLYSGIHVTTWDTFTGVNAAGQSPNVASASYSATLLNTTMAGGMLTGSGDRIYSGTMQGAAHPVSFNLTGSTLIDLPNLWLVIKSNAPSADFFTVTLNGTAPLGTGLASVTGEAAPNVHFFDFGPVAAGTNFTFSAISPAGHTSFDAIQIVPEPTSSLLAGLMGAGVFLRRRRC